MSSIKPITIIGGGLAGLTLGIGLRRQDVPVTIHEAGNYPRHRVCGEFISGSGQAVLERLGLLPQFEKAGAVYARSVMFIYGDIKSPARPLAAPALCLSRHKMDAMLAETFRQLGGNLLVNSRWTSSDCGEGIISAAGRRLQIQEKSPRWFGVKAHVSNANPGMLEADLEMHLSPDGYVGVSRIENGQVNVCGLFQARPGNRPESKMEWLRGQPGSSLRRRLGTSRFEPDSFCSVAGIQLKPQSALAKKECRIGDALTMTPPVTGNGMSMAFESAEAAIEPLAAYSRGNINWTTAQRKVAANCDVAFSHRLAWARFLQWLIISRPIQNQFGKFLLRSDCVWKLMFAQTR